MTGVPFLQRRNPSAAGVAINAMLVVQTNGLPSFEQTYANDKCLAWAITLQRPFHGRYSQPNKRLKFAALGIVIV
ncbi:hypothetical protein M0804_011627 [Polistes exclamans]|nr:hypothetical protein M0804_011627 [Polistes exclamans]